MCRDSLNKGASPLVYPPLQREARDGVVHIRNLISASISFGGKSSWMVLTTIYWVLLTQSRHIIRSCSDGD